MNVCVASYVMSDREASRRRDLLRAIYVVQTTRPPDWPHGPDDGRRRGGDGDGIAARPATQPSSSEQK
eukprot:3169749-Pyramimonas_sp.AAC.1